MEVMSTKNPDVINSAIFIILKYLIEVSLETAASNLPEGDPSKKMIEDALNGKVSNDDLSRIFMGYCISDLGALAQHMEMGRAILARQTEALVRSIGG